MAACTSGWMRSPGCVPAETARARAGSARALKNAAAICERPALCTQAKITVFIGSRATITPPCGYSEDVSSCAAPLDINKVQEATDALERAFPCP